MQAKSQDYFQQNVDYKIKVILDDEKHTLDGEIAINYTNNSNDTLSFIYFHLWPNAYKNNSTAFAKQQTDFGYTFFFHSFEEDKGFIDSLEFSIDGKNVEFELDDKHIDIAKLKLKKPLLPGESIKIESPFFVKIPYLFSRLGHIENQYFITQWYPKPAVYDAEGWHPFPYLDQGEFYSEFGSFEVDIYVPKEYIIAATGNQKSPVMLEGIVDSLITAKKLFNYKKVSFEEVNIHDFAWFASKNFTVQQRMIEIPGRDKKVKIQTFHEGGIRKKYENALDYVESALKFYSKKCFVYPYNTCKVVVSEADGGMEYPTITIVGPTFSELDFESVVVHEVGHNWFYGILGSNEREHAWIDEGFNSFYELLYFFDKYGYKNYKEISNDMVSNIIGIGDLSFSKFYKVYYQKLANTNSEIPIIHSSITSDSENYYTGNYFKMSLGLKTLQNQVGEHRFDSVMQQIFKEWGYKHPQPNDIRKYFQFEYIPTSWFFDDFLATTKKSDYKIRKVKDEKIYFKQTKSFASPLSLHISNEEESFDTTLFNPQSKFSIQSPLKNITNVQIDKVQATIDLNDRNNNYNSNQLFHKSDPFRIRLLGYYQEPGTNQISFLPFLSYNNYDKLMPGIFFFNSFVPSHTLEYYLLPSYGIKSKEFVGSSFGQLHINTNNAIFHSAQLNFSAYRYSIHDEKKPIQKYKLNPILYLNRSTLTKSYFSFKYHYLNIPIDFINNDTDLKHLVELKYVWDKNSSIKGKKIEQKIEGGKGFVKTSFEVNYFEKYPNKSNFKFRLFAGLFLYSSDDYYGDYRFRLSGLRGIHDYTYENFFLGRSESIKQDTVSLLARQFVKADGGFTTYTSLGQTKNWIVASNLNYKPPIFLPIEAYLNVAVLDYVTNEPGRNKFFWETGVEINIIPDIFEFYFPVFMSENIKEQSDYISDKYWDKVRFSINLNFEDACLFIKSL